MSTAEKLAPGGMSTAEKLAPGGVSTAERLTTATGFAALPQRVSFLRALPGGRRRLSTAAFGVLMGGLLGMGLLAVLLLNTILAQGAFAIHTLELESTRLDIAAQALDHEVAALGTPESLRLRAEALGMSPVTGPAYIRMPSGRVIGNPEPVPDAAPAPQDAAPAAPAAPAPAGDGAVVAASGSATASLGDAAEAVP